MRHLEPRQGSFATVLVFVDEVADHDGLVTVRAHTNRGNTAARNLFQLQHVLAGVLGQLIQALRIRNVLGPAVVVLKNRLSVVELSLSHRHLVVAHTVNVVSHADPDLIQAGQNVQLGDEQSR